MSSRTFPYFNAYAVGGFLPLVLLVLLQAARDAFQQVLALGVALRVAGGGGLLGGLGGLHHDPFITSVVPISKWFLQRACRFFCGALRVV